MTKELKYLLNSIISTQEVMEQSLDEAVKSKHWCYEIAQALIPGRDALYGLSITAKKILEDDR